MPDSKDPLAQQIAALFSGEGQARPDDQASVSRLASRAADALQSQVVGAFASEGAPRARDATVEQALAIEAADPLRDRVAELFEPEAAPRYQDAAIAARLARGAAPAPRRVQPRRRGLLATSPLLLAVVVISSAAAASTVIATRSYWAPRLFPTAPTTGVPVMQPKRPAPRKPRALALPVAQPAAPAVPVPAGPGSVASVARPPAPNAMELFARANRQRRGGQLAAAADSFRGLQRLHPRSTEARLSHLSLADLHLLAGRRREAVAQLDGYLRSAPDGQLVEEALYRKARTLDELGQRNGAAAVWRLLLSRYPQSLFGEEARRALARP